MMRENFTHWAWAQGIITQFCWVFSENTVGIGDAKEVLEIRLTAGAIRVKFANCPELKRKNNNLVNV
jgi:hypothetical protein